nr:MAG TPA: tail protein [Caudoviricetes sp.]
MAIDMIDVLCCKITIGDADSGNPMVIKDPIVLTEVEEVEIVETYKKLIGTAKITFPKGTVYQSTVIGNATIEGKDASRISTEIMQDGVVVEKRSSQQAMNDVTFKVGQRVNIKLGYNGILKNMFDGYISAYNSASKFEIQCENMAYKLKLKQAPKFETQSSVSVNDVLGDKYGLLKDTGFAIHSETKRFDIQIGKVKITDNFTVADVLSEWSKYKVYCFLKYDENSPDDMPTIAIGRPYSSSKSQPVFPKDSEAKPFPIYFNYHVAEDGLKVVKTNPKFLAVTGKALGSDEKFFEVTIRMNPDYDPTVAGSKEFQTVNATQISKKTHKVTGNTTAEGAKTKTKVDLSTYTIVPYMSPNMKIDSDKLVEETIEYFRNYNLNGITGSLTLFGDLALNTAVQVELIDERNPSKNGVYITEEVTTTFGVNGYRQKITIPYKIKPSN